MNRPAPFSFLAAALSLCAPALRADAAVSSGLEFFENKIRPILVDNCYKCHSSRRRKAQGQSLR